MKKLYCLLAALLLMAGTANATKYSLINGNFGSQVNGVSFANGDTLEIASGASVTYNSNMTIGANIVFDIRGSFNMNGNNKVLTLGAGSIVNLWPNAAIAGSSATQQLFIGTKNVFDGAQTINSSYFVLTATGSQNFWVGAPLPLHFLSFDATLRSVSTVRLAWTATNDGPATAFMIEVSTDGKRWNDAARVAARGGAHETVGYVHELQTPISAKTAMYRIRYDGGNGAAAVYSKIRTVTVNSLGHANPMATVTTAGNEIKVSLTEIVVGGSAHVIVTSLAGKTIYNQPYNAAEVLNIPVFMPGMYVVTVTDNVSFKVAQKVVLQ
jgi:hypothetical protein